MTFTVAQQKAEKLLKEMVGYNPLLNSKPLLTDINAVAKAMIEYASEQRQQWLEEILNPKGIESAPLTEEEKNLLKEIDGEE